LLTEEAGYGPVDRHSDGDGCGDDEWMRDERVGDVVEWVVRLGLRDLHLVVVVTSADGIARDVRAAVLVGSSDLKAGGPRDDG
jgi:hypothetical protein